MVSANKATPSAVGERVLPLLCEEVLKKSKPFQRLNLETFLARLPQLHRCLVLTSDAELLLALLFQLQARRPGITELDAFQTHAVAQLALRILHWLFVEPHPYFETFLAALQRVMARMGLTEENFYRRPTVVDPSGDTIRQLSVSPPLEPPSVLADPPIPSPGLPTEEEEEEDPEEEEDSTELGAEGVVDFGDMAMLSAKDFYFRMYSKFKEEPYGGARPKSARTRLAMRDLYPLKAGFDDMDQNGSEMLAYSELADFHDQTGWEFTRSMWDQIDTDSDGLVSFLDLMRAWFPLVPVDQLEQKVALLPTATDMKRRRQKAQLAQERQEERSQRGGSPTDSAYAVADKRREAMLFKDDAKDDRWRGYVQTSAARVAAGAAAEAPRAATVGPIQLAPADLHLDVHLENATLRPLLIELLTAWDYSSINVAFFMEKPVAHLYLPHRFRKRARVFRDFVTAGPRPYTAVPWEGYQHAHIKTNIPLKSDVMYRIVVEGYNYGVNAPIHSDIVGYTHRRWNKLGAMEDFGWPQGWDQNTSNDYAKGAVISQYFSSDGFVVVRLTAKSLLFAGFSASAFLLNHGYGADFLITAEVFQSDQDL